MFSTNNKVVGNGNKTMVKMMSCVFFFFFKDDEFIFSMVFPDPKVIGSGNKMTVKMMSFFFFKMMNSFFQWSFQIPLEF